MRSRPSPVSPFVLGLALGGTVAAQGFTDPAVVTTYGAPCGVDVTAHDTILGNGNHATAFDVTTPPLAPALLVLGFDAIDVPLAGPGCHLLAEPLILWFAPSDAGGHASFTLNMESTFVGTVRAQAATLDAALAISTSHGLELEFPGVSPTPDPAAHTEYPCVYTQTLVWNYGGDGVPAVTGKVWWPSATCQSSDGPPNGLPLVVFLHGNGMTNADHDAILSHIARNGFVVASITNGAYMGGSNEGRAREAISYLNGMHAFWGWSARLTNDVAFAGHSRGGEAAATAARLLSEQPALAFTPYDVECVLSIAPTDGGGDGSDPKESLDGTMTRSFLAIYGSRDPDVRGVRLEDPLVGPEATPFALYDRAGNESSTEGLLLPAANITKSMVFVHGATHRGFLDGCNVLDGGTIGCTAHRDIARGYATAFLRWHVLGDAEYRAYFDGTATPTKVRVADVEVFEQFASRPRRVIDNFEQGGWSLNSQGGTVLAGPGIAQIDEDQLWELDPSAPHDTSGMRIRWGAFGGSPIVGWGLPAVNIPLVGPNRDVSSYDYLSVRVAQDYADPWNVPGQDQDFRVRLLTGNVLSFPVKISDHGRIPAPDPFLTFPFPYPAGDFTKSALTTIRVPLTAFFGADLHDVRAVYFYFDVPGHTTGSILVDSLEFAN